MLMKIYRGMTRGSAYVATLGTRAGNCGKLNKPLEMGDKEFINIHQNSGKDLMRGGDGNQKFKMDIVLEVFTVVVTNVAIFWDIA
jgi:hypothetical protein